jgi:hypothetical protein
MPDRHTVQLCRWAEPTVFLANPLWTAAEDYPWSCRRDGAPHAVEDTQACETCPRWEPQPAPDRRNPGISEGW